MQYKTHHQHHSVSLYTFEANINSIDTNFFIVYTLKAVFVIIIKLTPIDFINLIEIYDS